MANTNITKIIDIERSYVPIDPMSFPESMHSTGQEDQPEKRIPVIPYDGHNFMPTGYGYQSYFGVNSELDIEELGNDTSSVSYLEAYTIAWYAEFVDEEITTMTEVYAFEAELTETEITTLAQLLAFYDEDTFYEFIVNELISIDLVTGMDVPTLTGAMNVDELFIVQTETYQNIFVALCENGIKIKYGGATGDWTDVITLAAPAAGEHKNWTYCVIGNEVYMYRAGNASVYVMNDANSWTPTAAIPTHLTMAGQLGIFKAGGRLGFWDSENSISWSDADVKTDFVPSLETGAGASIFQQIVGRISAVRQHGNGFIIYATRSVVHVRRTTDAYQFWSAETVFNENGVSYLHESCQGQPDTVHFAYTTFGMVKIEDGKAEYIIPEIFSYLKEKRTPVYLRLLEGRYLFFQTLAPNFINPPVQFDTEEVPASVLTFQGASYAVENVQSNVCRALNAINASQESIYLYDEEDITEYP